jgi:solute carrier family 38 (sodium-coupled neutral amino acid transporter), member 11
MAGDKSPFFAPSTPRVIAQTPGGTKRSVKQTVEEKKSTIVGATANLINAIIGSGIIGIPFAIQQAGLVAGFILVCLCALLTDKSLRLLVETAKHASSPSYETTLEAAFGRFGFLFVTINMFIMSYGAMVSYLMVVKDTIPFVLGVSDPDTRRALLFVISLFIMVPLSAQRDMANLAYTSRISVILDILMVGLVAYLAPIGISLEKHGGLWNVLQTSTFRIETIFVGLGVLSFAFVCQHSAFIIAGSLQNPTKLRWSIVTFRSLCLCVCLANLCGISGYLGFMESTQGNILNNLSHDGFLPNLARGLLGTTMLFVFPMELFVARHVCVVTFFQGRRAHEGDDATILNRRDRRITLTVVLYALALIPAMMFQNMGNVLSVTGAIGGSSLSYIGPGAVYIGIHGAAFVKMVNDFWKIGVATDTERLPLRNSKNANSLTSLQVDSLFIRYLKCILWYILGIPIWYALAQAGAEGFNAYKTDLMGKSPHPSRIGRVKSKDLPNRSLIRAGSMSAPSYQTGMGPSITIIPPAKPLPAFSNALSSSKPTNQVEESDLEDDPQEIPEVMDFVVAIGFCIFGVLALCAGVLSIFVAQTSR